MPRNYRSFFAALMLSVVFLWMALSRPLHTSLNWDAAGYFFYLPALFIQHDLPLENRQWFEDLRQTYDLSGTLYQVHEVPGRQSHVNQYTCGMAVVLLPAFAVAHLVATYSAYPADGYSLPYSLAAAWWSLAIALAGIWAFRRMILRFFSDGVSALVLILLLGGTNYLIQVSGNLVSPHNYLLLLFVIFIAATNDWYTCRNRKDFYLLVLTGGLASLIRPTEVLWFVIPLCWTGVTPTQVWRNIRHHTIEYRTMILRSGALLILLALPQIAYWMISTGRPLFMSYSNPGEGLDLLNPHTLDFLFSFRKGWFIYTPIVLVALAGFWVFIRQRGNPGRAVLLFFLVNLYIVSSWTTWWYAQSFSQRAMIQTLPLLALPLGSALEWMRTTRVRRWMGAFVVSGFFALTVLYQFQYVRGVLHPDRMTRAYFMSVFGKLEKPSGVEEFLLVERPFDGEMVFSDSLHYRMVESFALSDWHSEAFETHDSIRGIALYPGREFTPAMHRLFRELTRSDHVWLRIEAETVTGAEIASDDVLLVATAEHKGGVYGYRTWAFNHIQNLGVERTSASYLTPEVRSKKDPIAIYIWHRGLDTVYVKDIRVRVYERNAPGG